MGSQSQSVADLATRQHGVVARRQLRALGVGASAIDHWVQGGRLHVLHRGVYAVGHRHLTPKSRCIAAVLACGDGALLSHRSAAELWRLRTGGTRIEVTTESSGRSGPRGVVLHETHRIHPEDRHEIDRIPVTSLSRTLVDLARVVEPRRLERAFEEAERIGKLDVRLLQQALDRAPAKRGTGTLRRLIAEARCALDTKSELESDFIAYLRANELPLPLPNVLVHGYLVDAYWPDHRLVAELDGYAFHDRTRRSFDGDRERTIDLQLAGYTVVRLTSRTMPLIASFLSRPGVSAAR